MGAVGQPGHVRCQKLYREILNKVWKLYRILKPAMQDKLKYTLKICHCYVLFVLPWTGPNLKSEASM